MSPDHFSHTTQNADYSSIFHPKILLLIIFTVTTGILFGQDIHYSLFNNSPLYLNPAFTGHFEGDWRVGINYRNQWSSVAIPYKTTSANFDKQFYVYNRHISAGAFFINDLSGDAALQVNKLYLSGAYHTSVNTQNIHIGIQVGYVMKKVDYASLTFPDQFDMNSGSYNSGLPTGENNAGEHVGYLDINTGVVWNTKTGILEPEAGLALYHINNPNESFFGGESRQPVRMVMHSRVKVLVGNTMYLEPGFLFMSQRKVNDMMVGTNAGLNIPGHPYSIRSVFTGLYLRHGFGMNTESVVVKAGLTRRNMDVVIGYDINISPLSVASNNRGAFEIALVYKSISTILNSYSIPCERF